MEEKIWEFEGYWYIHAKGYLPLCVNSREAAGMLLEFMETTPQETIMALCEKYKEGMIKNNEP